MCAHTKYEMTNSVYTSTNANVASDKYILYYLDLSLTEST